MNKVEKIWMNGKFVNWDDAKIHVLSHVVHYGSSWFEGIRCYGTKKGSAIFRLDRHVQRLFDSAKIYRAEIPFTKKEIESAIKETIKVNKMKACYIRPVVYRGYGDVGVSPIGCPIDVSIIVWEWGKYLGSDALDKGIDVRTASWSRPAPNTLPTMAKTGANYMNSQLIKLEALADGYAEGIALDVHGQISEGSGENIFVVRDGSIVTPPLIDALLPGVTRASVITLAKEAGISVTESHIPRELLYIADEVFFTGTAAEITPIRTIDRMTVGDGKPGPVTRELQKRFMKIVQDGKDSHGWLTFVK
ncbi:MAG TPA: branched-chain amino acid transaminase [Bacteroidota bacterium]|nr:branched-chain amino acid transaminase [Bacteroidota bacterium]